MYYHANSPSQLQSQKHRWISAHQLLPCKESKGSAVLGLNGSSATEELSAFLLQTVPVKTGSTVILLLACLSLQDMLCQISVDLVPGSVLCHQNYCSL